MDALFRHRWAGRTGGANERPCSVEKWPELRLAVRLSVVGAASHGVAVLASISAVAARFGTSVASSLLKPSLYQTNHSLRKTGGEASA